MNEIIKYFEKEIKGIDGDISSKESLHISDKYLAYLKKEKMKFTKFISILKDGNKAGS